MSYKNPDFVEKNVHHRKNTLDERMIFATKLLEEAPLDKIKNVLDIGMGRGEFASWFSKKGMMVTGTGINMSSYDLDEDILNDKNINTVECDVEKMPFEDETFDAVLASHILEHCFNLGMALKEIRRVLKKDGYLFVFLPEYVTTISVSHLTTGWNVGQLLVTLLLNGFNVRTGKFLHKEHQVCAFVQRSDTPLPPLRGDSGDTHILYKAGFFPEQLKFADRNFESFEGYLTSLNWDTDVKQKIYHTKKQKILIFISKLIPKKILRTIVFYLRIAYSTLNDYWFVTK
jgi:ubiquinone/menaquinone biosynthesis C-methylase UbiE